MTFVGIGEPPPPQPLDSEAVVGDAGHKDPLAEFGHCSQAAIFVRRDFWQRTMLCGRRQSEEVDSTIDSCCSAADDDDNDEPYRLISRTVMPVLRDERTREQRILDQAQYHLNLLRNDFERYYSHERGVLAVPVRELHEAIWRDRDFDVAEMRAVMRANGFTIGRCDDDDDIELDPFEEEDDRWSAEEDDEQNEDDGDQQQHDDEVDDGQMSGVPPVVPVVDECEEELWN